MTVAVLLFAHTIPVVITDSLISATDVPKHEIDTPLTSSETREGLGGYVPVGIAQKMWHSQNLVFLYAGIVEDADRLFKFLNNKMHYGEPVYTDEVHADITRYVEDNGLRISFIVICNGLDGFIHHYGYNVIHAEGPLFGRCLMIGTGKEPLLALLDKIDGTPLPPSNDLSNEHISLVFLNALRALATVTNDYMKNESLLAIKSTGAFFNLSYLPELYGFEPTKIPSIIASGICQIFLNIVGDRLFIKRVVISRQIFGQGTTDVILMNQDILIKAAYQELHLPADTLKIVTIGMKRTESSWKEFVPRDCYGVNSVIVYVERALSDKPGNIARKKKILLNDPPILTISQTITGVSLHASTPFMQSVVENLRALQA
jgi:hypothetical protein